MMNLIFRDMSSNDIDAVLEIERSIYAFPWTPGNFNDCLVEGYQCHVLIEDDKLIGYGLSLIHI